jgi:hypothetical protein
MTPHDSFFTKVLHQARARKVMENGDMTRHAVMFRRKQGQNFLRPQVERS